MEQTVRAMAEKEHRHFQPLLEDALRLDQANEYDLIVNMSGFRLPDGIHVPTVVRRWDVPDPIGASDEVVRLGTGPDRRRSGYPACEGPAASPLTARRPKLELERSAGEQIRARFR